MMETPLRDVEKQTVLNIFKLVKASWPKDIDTPSFKTAMIKKTAEVAGVPMATVYDIIKEDRTKDQALPPRQWKHKKNCSLKIKEHTKLDIAKVYHFLEQEYEELKKRFMGLDLTPLSKFSQRTALATGVSESVVLEIVQEEERQSTDMRQEKLQKQSLVHNISRHPESSSEEDCFASLSSTAHGRSNRDHTEIFIAKVYHYFEQEYESLKRTYVDLHLTPLLKFHQRTALATGVSESTVEEILQEEGRRNADMRQEQLRKQNLAGVKDKRLETSEVEWLQTIKEEPLQTYEELVDPLVVDVKIEPQDEEDTNGTRRSCTRVPGRGRGVRVGGGRSAGPAPPSPRSLEPVAIPPPPELVAPARTGHRGGHAGYGSKRPGPHTIEELVKRQVEELLRGRPLETPLHVMRKRMRQPSVPAAPSSPPRSLLPLPVGGDAGNDGASTSRSAMDVGAPPSPQPSGTPSPAAISSELSPETYLECGQVSKPAASPSSSPSMQPPPARRRPHHSLRGANLNHGSDADSDDASDEGGDDVPTPMIPRVFRAMMTPWDRDEDDDEEDGAGATPATDPVLAGYPAPAADHDPSGTDQPWNLYDFEWRSFPTSPIPPESRRETFSQINVGPTIPDVDPYSIFVAIWDRQFMEYIASETNRYAQQVASRLFEDHNLHPKSRISRWVDTTADELYIFLGVMLAMGVVVKARLEEYWSASPDIFSTPRFSAHMTVDRFKLLQKCLHFVNNGDMCAVDLDVSEARLFKIRPVLLHLNSKFQNLYVLSQNIALDESLLMWKGWLEIGQLIPNKAATRGIKSYEICESRTGYLWRFEVHSNGALARQPEPENQLDKTTPAIVLRLTQGLEYKGYTLWMDNFYNSPAFARRLKSLGFDCAGTLRKDCQFLPEALRNLTKRRMRQGDVSGLTSGDVDVMVWRDSNRVATISTYHGNAVHTTRGATKPILIHDYNIMMGGVDKKDQILAMYPVERKRTKVWYKKLFRRLLNVSVLNSFVIHCANAASSRTSILTHRGFRITLIKSLLSNHAGVNPLPRPIPQNVVDVTHRLSLLARSGTQRLRRRCAVCKKQVQTFCVGCDQTVCLEPCFLILHTGIFM